MSDRTSPDAPVPNPTIRLSLPDGEQPGERIGPYKLLQPIGEGGMGSVWRPNRNSPSAAASPSKSSNSAWIPSR